MDIYALVRETIATGVCGREAASVKTPARRAAASVYAPEMPAVAVDAFADVLGAPLVTKVTRENDWLLFGLTDAFYDACVRTICDALPKPADDAGSYAMNRMLALARQTGEGCPRNAQVQRALWLMLGAAYGYTSPEEAGQAFLRMLDPLPARARMEARRTCGQMADACARLYARTLTLPK